MDHLIGDPGRKTEIFFIPAEPGDGAQVVLRIAVAVGAAGVLLAVQFERQRSVPLGEVAVGPETVWHTDGDSEVDVDAGDFKFTAVVEAEPGIEAVTGLREAAELIRDQAQLHGFGGVGTDPESGQRQRRAADSGGAEFYAAGDRRAS